jgi:hypothetical protein
MLRMFTILMNKIYHINVFLKSKKLTHHLSHGLRQVVDYEVGLPVILQLAVETNRSDSAHPAQHLQASLHHLKQTIYFFSQNCAALPGTLFLFIL